MLEANNRCHHQTWNGTRHSSHWPSVKPKRSIINKLKIQRGTEATHQLESQVYTLSAGLKVNKELLTNWKGRTGALNRHDTQQDKTVTHMLDVKYVMIRLEIEQGTAATHHLKNQKQALSINLKYREVQKPLTNCRVKVYSMHQQVWKSIKSYSPSEKGRTGVLSRHEI